METLGSRLRYCRNQLGLSCRVLGDVVGTSGATISNWETGATLAPDYEMLQKAALRLGTTVEWLRTGRDNASPRTGATRADPRSDADTEAELKLPIFGVSVSAGPGAELPEFAEETGTMSVTAHWLRELGARKEHIRIVSVAGDSMVPTLYDGDRIALNINDRQIRNEHVYALAYGNEAKVKRLSRQADGSLRISSDNPDKGRYPSEIIQGEALNDIVVLGRIIHKMGDGGLH